MPEVLQTIAVLRDILATTIADLLPEPHAALLQGLLLGGGGNLPRATWEAFRGAGLLHIVAVSGTNVALVIAAVDALLFWLPRRWRLVPSAVIIAGYTALTGASASAVRAAIMGTLALVALHLGRQADRRRLIGAAFLVMAAVHPRWLTDDAGFQLSFLAVIGIAEVGPLMEPYLRHVPRMLGIREAILLTMAAQLTAAPWGAHVFGGFSLIAPLANLLIAPAIPLAMLSGTLSIVAFMVAPLLGLLFALPCAIILGWMIGVAETLGGLSIASMDWQPSLLAIAAYYAFLIAACATIRRRTPSSVAAVPEFSASARAHASRTGTHATRRASPPSVSCRAAAPISGAPRA